MPIGSYCERPARTVGADETVRAAARDQLRMPRLTETSRLAIADAIANLSQAPRAQ